MRVPCKSETQVWLVVRVNAQQRPMAASPASVDPALWVAAGAVASKNSIEEPRRGLWVRGVSQVGQAGSPRMAGSQPSCQHLFAHVLGPPSEIHPVNIAAGSCTLVDGTSGQVSGAKQAVQDQSRSRIVQSSPTPLTSRTLHASRLHSAALRVTVDLNSALPPPPASQPLEPTNQPTTFLRPRTFELYP